MELRRTFRKTLLSLIAVAAPAALAFAGEAEYQLGTWDKIRIKVFEYRETLSDVEEWPALGGSYTIDAQGAIKMPMLGTVPASGRSVAALEQEIAELIKSKAALEDVPQVTVEVTSSRPVYVTGGVERIGEYSYEPGMTLRHVLIAAGGAERGPAGSQDAAALDGERKLAALELLSLKARRARLQAEADGRDAIEFPADITAAKDGSAAEYMKSEEQVFRQHKLAESQGDAAASQQQDLLEQKLSILGERLKVAQEQEKIAQEALRRIKRFGGRGSIAILRTQSLQRSIGELRAAQLDYKGRMIDARQSILALGSDAARADYARAAAALLDIQSVDFRLAQVTERLAQIETSLARLGGAGTGTAGSATAGLHFVIRRNGSVSDAVDLDTPVLPGDVVEVKAKNTTLAVSE